MDDDLPTIQRPGRAGAQIRRQSVSTSSVASTSTSDPQTSNITNSAGNDDIIRDVCVITEADAIAFEDFEMPEYKRTRWDYL